MKPLENKPTEIAKEGEDLVDYIWLINQCLNQMPEGGFTRSELKARARIDAVLEKTNGTIELEDADAEKLKRIVRLMRWKGRHADLVQFHDDVEEACK